MRNLGIWAAVRANPEYYYIVRSYMMYIAHRIIRVIKSGRMRRVGI
jgi:hypothetical protein